MSWALSQDTGTKQLTVMLGRENRHGDWLNQLTEKLETVV